LLGFDSLNAHVGQMILGHVGLPLLAYLIMVKINAIAKDRKIPYGEWLDISIELCILGMGSTGGIFVSNEIATYFGPLALVTIIMFDLWLAASLVRRRQNRVKHPVEVGLMRAMWDLLYGGTTVGLACAVIWVGLELSQTKPEDPTPPPSVTTPTGVALQQGHGGERKMRWHHLYSNL
jgi:hypothetical protein